ncbi:hypothetical protein KDL44_03225 [bacterium]|nr:hypothetical protein [bacterium]
MSSLDTRFGHPDDWGLSPERHSEIANELSDHLDCLQADEGSDAASATEEKLSEPRVRRKLSAAHIADQVVATLHRRPNHAEWRELGWLLFWFVFVMLGDYLNGIANELCPQPWSGEAGSVPLGQLSVLAWLILGVSRTGFLVSLAMGCHAAWRRGAGVLLARLIQYKLIHTVVVVAGLLLINQGFHEAMGNIYFAGLPQMQLHARSIACGVWLGSILLCAVFLKRQRWQLALAGAIGTAMLYATGPGQGHFETISRPFPVVRIVKADGSNALVTPDRAYLESWKDEFLRYGNLLPDDWSFDHPYDSYNIFHPDDAPLSAAAYIEHRMYGFDPEIPGGRRETRIEGILREDWPDIASTPSLAVGCGIAWLAAPVPLLGVLGLLSMLFIMGRRGILASLLYALLTMLALFCSVLPFVMTQKLSQVLELSPLAFAAGPLPGFEQILNFPVWELNAGHAILGALLISAGIPWLLTGLFLKSGNDSHQTADDTPDMETA